MSARGRLLAASILIASSAARAQGTIDTVAGGGPGDGSPALAVNLRTPQDVVRDAAGVTYVAVSDDRRVYKIALDGTIALVAGSGGSGSFGDGGPAAKAELVSPKGLAFDTDGSLLIADEGGRRIRRVDLSSGKISTLVGGGALTGEGVAALQVLLDAPRDVAVGPGGNLFIADGNRVRKLDRGTGLVTTAAGSTTAGFSDGSPAATKRLSEPRALAFDAVGSLYIADGGNGRIRKLVLSTDTISTLVNGICSPGGVATDAAGVVYFTSNTGSCGNNGQKYMKWVSGSVSTIGSTGSSFVAQISSLSGGSLLVADRDNYRIRTVSASGSATNVAGNGTIGTYGGGVPAQSASFLSPTHVRADAAGNVYVYDGTSQIRRVTPAGLEVTVVSAANCSNDPKNYLCSVEGLAMLPGGLLAFSESKNDKLRKLDPTTGVVTDLTSAALGRPKGIAFSASGFVYVADRGNGNNNGAIRKVQISTGAMTVIVSNLAKPQSIAVDGSDNVYFASLDGNTIQKIAAGTSTVVNYVALTSAVTGLDADAGGNLFAADSSDQVWRIAAGTGTTSLYAGAGAAGLGDGGSPLTATLSGPSGLSLVGSNLYVADALNYRIRLVRPNTGPSAAAGADQVVEATSPSGATVTLDGTGSSDPDGDALSYSWSGSFGTVTGSGPSVTLPLGTHTVMLTVSDGQVSSSDTVSVTVQDTIAPTISAIRSPLPNANGWNNTDVTVSFSCTDSGSGLSFGPPAPQVVALEAAGQSRSFTCTDAAGNQSSLTVSGINIDKTAPVIATSASPKPNAAGWNNSDVTVSFAASDALSGMGSCDSAVVLSGDGAGQSASGACTDRAGNTAQAQVSGINLDKTAPVATAGRSPLANPHGWNNTDVTVTVTGVDNLSGIAGCTLPVVLSAEGAGQSASGTCTDLAGNVSASTSLAGINIDKTAPTPSAVVSPSPNTHGWNNSDVTVAFSATDALSGVLSCDPSATLALEGAGQSASGSCSDLAGNSAQTTASHINIDKTAPALAFATPSPAANAHGWNNTDVALGFTASDALSGVDTTSTVSPLLLTQEGASVSTTVSVTDLAGNSASFSSPAVKIDKTAPVVSASRLPLANAHGWNNGDVTVSASATDALAGIDGCDPDVVLATEGASQSVTRSCTDLAGNSDSATVSGINIDRTAPVASASASPSANAHGWNNTDVSVTFSATDALSGVLSCDPSATLALEGAGQSASGSCMDLAGNSAQAAASNINIDKTAPSLSFAAASPAANANGWNNSNVSFSFSASDALSGVDATSIASPLVLSSEGISVSGSVSVTDLAGNTASFDSPAVRIDKGAPTVTGSRAPLANAQGWNNSDVTVSVSATDGLSGVESCQSDLVISGEGASQSATRSCTDVAGNTASATVSGINIDKTAPVPSAIPSPSANTHGWNNTDVSVTFSATDALSGVLSCDPSAMLALEGAGQSASGSCMDLAGNSAQATASNINIDKTAPTLAFAAPSPAANANGWNNSDVAFSFTASDALSGVDSTSSSSPLVLSAEGNTVSGSVSVTDLAGNTASFDSPAVRIDKGAPTVTGSRAPLANAQGWNNTDVTVSVSATDGLSGVESCESEVVLSSEGASQSVTRTCTDLAGNVASATVSGINIDKTAPVPSAIPSPSANAHGWNNTDVSVTFSATDALSGVLSCDPSAMLALEGAGQSASGSCMDLAGNSAQATASNINIDKTMPSLSFAAASPAANVNGWNNTNVAFTFTASDALSGVGSTSMPSPLVLSAEGVAVSGTVSVTDIAGNTASFTSPVVMIDKTAPVVSGTRAPLANASGWNNSNVTVSVSATDALSGVASCDASVTLSAEGAAQSATRSCTDLAGNSASATVSSINIDKTAPGVSGTPARPADKNGWYNHAMSLTWSGTDSLSGIASCSSASTYNGPDDASVSLSGQCTDRAGNQGSGSFALKYDATAPTVSLVTPPNGATYALNQSVAAQYTCADNLSGVDGCSGPVANGATISTAPVGSKTFKVTATDAAGNQSSATNSYAIQYKFSGFLQPVDNLPTVNVANAGRTIPVKWQLKDAANASISDLASAQSLLWASMACDAAPTDIIEEETVATGGTQLRYDGTQFIYNWNTAKTWAGTCVQLQLTLADGTKQYAKFRFK